MSDIFIAHAEEDQALAVELAVRLERAGYSAWHYERDSLPGTNFLEEACKAIEECKIFILLASPRAIESQYVDKEVMCALEYRKRIMPLMVDIVIDELRSRKRSWGMAIGAQAALQLPSSGIDEVLPRIVGGLEKAGIRASRTSAGVIGGHGLPIGKAREFVVGSKPSTKRIYGRKVLVQKCLDLIMPDEGVDFLCLHGTIGVGKSTIASLVYSELTRSDSNRFGHFVWYAIGEDAGPATALAQLISFMTEGVVSVSNPDDQPFETLLDLLRTQLANSSAFAVFDNLDSIFEPGAEAGTFKDKRWPQLFKAFLGGKSAIMATSHQMPKFQDRAVGTMEVTGIPEDEAIKLMRDEGLQDDERVLREAYNLTLGHPMALCALAAAVVRKPSFRKRLSKAGDIMEALRRSPDPSANPLLLLDKVIRPDLLSQTEYSVLTAMPILFRPETAEFINILRPEQTLGQINVALDELFLRSLVRTDDADPPLHSLHPLVGDVARKLADSPEVLHDRACTAYSARTYPEDTKNPGDVDHLRMAVLHALAIKDLPRAKAILYDKHHLAERLEKWGRFDLALPLHRKELEVSRELEGDEDIMRAAGLVSECLTKVGSCVEALPLAREALEIAVLQRDMAKEGEYRGQIGRIHYRTGDFAESYKWLEEALALATKSRDKRCEGIFRGFIGLILSSRGEFDDALRMLDTARRLSFEEKDTASEIRWSTHIGRIYSLRGDYSKAGEVLEPASRTAGERGDVISQSRLSALIGENYVNTGEFDRALQEFDHALKVDRLIGNRRHEGGILALIGKIHKIRGEYKEALGITERAVAIADELNSKGAVAFRRGRMGEILLMMGDLDNALEHLNYALAYSLEQQDPSNECPWRGGIGEVYFQRGEYSKALQWLEKAHEISIELKDRENENEWLGKIGQVYLETRQYDEAQTRLVQALDIATAIGDIVNERGHRINLGRFSMTDSKPCEAVPHFERALEIGNKLGVVRELIDGTQAELEQARAACGE